MSKNKKLKVYFTRHARKRLRERFGIYSLRDLNKLIYLISKKKKRIRHNSQGDFFIDIKGMTLIMCREEGQYNVKTVVHAGGRSKDLPKEYRP